MQVGELRPRLKRIKIRFKVVSKEEPQEVKSRKDNSRHMVSDLLVGDETGIIVLTLWDEEIEDLEKDKIYDLTNGYTSVYKGSLRLNIGRYGKLQEVEDPEFTVDESKNVSEEEHERYVQQRRTRMSRYGSGSFWPDR